MIETFWTNVPCLSRIWYDIDTTITDKIKKETSAIFKVNENVYVQII